MEDMLGGSALRFFTSREVRPSKRRCCCADARLRLPVPFGGATPLFGAGTSSASKVPVGFGCREEESKKLSPFFHDGDCGPDVLCVAKGGKSSRLIALGAASFAKF